jgi:hypothetical protein
MGGLVVAFHGGGVGRVVDARPINKCETTLPILSIQAAAWVRVLIW